MKQYDYAGAKNTVQIALSTFSASAARRLKMKMIPTGIEVDAVTGISVKADPAVCRKYWTNQNRNDRLSKPV